ncbi:MAG: M50 family metallopeptidase, partial [Candidatus Omnitrophica bacterium]|nr:M50 family metallopeptidase [Candidatus Omnitrophota bacterium]
MFKKIIHIALAILFLPVCVSISAVFYEYLGKMESASLEQLYFFYGCVAYLAFHAILFKPERMYVFGHEMLHAVAAILLGGKVHSIKVSKKGGSVTASKNNAFISLAPYLFPFYTILAAAVYFIAAHFMADVSGYLRMFLFIVGFTITFHIVLTVDVLKIKQTDLLNTGYIFSVEFIY